MRLKAHYRIKTILGLNSVTGRTISPLNKNPNNNVNSNESYELQEQLKKDDKRKPLLVTETLESSVSPVALSSTTITSTSRRVPITTPKSAAKLTSFSPSVLVSTIKVEITTENYQETLSKEIVSNSGIKSDFSSPPVTTFTISSSQDVGKLF